MFRFIIYIYIFLLYQHAADPISKITVRYSPLSIFSSPLSKPFLLPFLWSHERNSVTRFSRVLAPRDCGQSSRIVKNFERNEPVTNREAHCFKTSPIIVYLRVVPSLPLPIRRIEAEQRPPYLSATRMRINIFLEADRGGITVNRFAVAKGRRSGAHALTVSSSSSTSDQFPNLL